MAKRYWLMKSEPDAYSIDDLARDGVTPWEGVRSYQARNLLRDEIRVGDGVLFYHSSTQPPGVIGLAEVVHESYPDRTQFDPASPYFDPKSTPDAPRWFVVDVRFVERFAAVVPLAVLQATPGLESMLVTKKGMRLSVQPVTSEEWDIVVALGCAASSEVAPVARSESTRAPTRSKGAGAAPRTPTRSKGAGAAPRAPARKAAPVARASTKRAGAKPGATGTKVAGRDRTPGRGRPPAHRR
jgi:predicted RNA-binding protein with PUA-like domain